MIHNAKFYPKEEDFPDMILCPLCRHQKACDNAGTNECKTIMAMTDDMESTDGSFLG